LYEESGRGSLGAEDGLHTRATLPADRCHLDDGAVRVNRDDGDDTAIWEKYIVKRTVSIDLEPVRAGSECAEAPA
jgi:hypothetical protein